MTRRGFTAAVLAVGLALAACGSDDGGDSAPATTAASGGGATETTAAAGGGGTESTAPATAPVPEEGDLPSADAYDLDATLRYMYSVGPSRFDPHRGTSSFDNTSLFLVYDRLVHQAPNAAAVPGLATEWEFSEDGSTLTFTIRDGVTFHDGTPLDAEAVKANIERGQTVEGSAVASELAVIESVEVVDGNKVQLNLSGPAAQLPLVFSDRAGMMISPAAFDDPELDQAPVGAGMYKVVEYRPNDVIIMERHEGYWDPDAARAARFEFYIAGDAVTRLNAIRSGQVDITFVDPQQQSEAESAGLQVRLSSGLAFYHLQLNRSFEPFANEQVRKALNHAIDRSQIVDGLLFGLGEASTQIFPKGYFGYSEEAGSEMYPYDPELARSLLAEAGYADGFEFEVIVPTIPLIQQLGEIVQAQLAELGITANIRSVEPAQTADIFYARQEGQGLVSPWGGRPDPAQTLSLLFSDEGFSNPGRHSTPEVMDAIAETRKVQSAEARAAAIQNAAKVIAEQAFDVPIYFPVTPSIFTDEVIGVREWLSGKPEFRGVGIAAG